MSLNMYHVTRPILSRPDTTAHHNQQEYELILRARIHHIRCSPQNYKTPQHLPGPSAASAKYRRIGTPVSILTIVVLVTLNQDKALAPNATRYPQTSLVILPSLILVYEIINTKPRLLVVVAFTPLDTRSTIYKPSREKRGAFSAL